MSTKISDKPSRVIELGSSTGKLAHTINVYPVLGYFPDPGTANSLMGGIPTGGAWRELGSWTIEIRHTSGKGILYAGPHYNAARLKKEVARALALLEGWRILSDSAGLLEIGAVAA